MEVCLRIRVAENDLYQQDGQREREIPRALDEVEKAFGKDALPFQLPIGAGESFSGIIDLLRMKAFTI